MKLFLGTKNQNKIKEISSILADLKIQLISPDNSISLPDVEENASTFEENAKIKALAFANFATLYFNDNSIFAIADDSGLEVEALGGKPGILSARYADTNDKRIERVLKELREVEKMSLTKNRNARFVCVIALAKKNQIINTFEGTIYGQIIDSPRGNYGFGYDPIFVPHSYSKTFAEIPPEIKNQISHRAKALEQLKLFLKNMELGENA